MQTFLWKAIYFRSLLGTHKPPIVWDLGTQKWMAEAIPPLMERLQECVPTMEHSRIKLIWHFLMVLSAGGIKAQWHEGSGLKWWGVGTLQWVVSEDLSERGGRAPQDSRKGHITDFIGVRSPERRKFLFSLHGRNSGKKWEPIWDWDGVSWLLLSLWI